MTLVDRCEREKPKWSQGSPLFQALVLTFVALSVACSDEAPTFPVRVDRSFVTGPAALALQPDGRFALPDSVTNPPSEISESQARAIAQSYVVAAGPSLRGVWSELHGSPVDIARLRLCDRALYAITPYTGFSAEVSEVATRTFGPHWVVPMCGASGRVQVVITFSSLATELAPEPEANKPRPWERGHLGSFGVPASAASDLYSPEAAATKAFNATRRGIAQVPVLVMSPMPADPGLVRWRIGLETAVTVVGAESRSERSVQSLFVGFGSVLGVSGLLDRKPGAEVMVDWKDIANRQPFSVTLSPLAPAGVELVDTGGRP